MKFEKRIMDKKIQHDLQWEKLLFHTVILKHKNMLQVPKYYPRNKVE